VTGPPSLVIVALPRTMSSLVHRSATEALGLDAPLWTDDGEVLNADRLAHFGEPRFDESVKYVTSELEPDLFDRVLAFAADVVHPTGHAYKDVTQPFVTAELLRRAPQAMRVLVIERPITDIVFSMSIQRWRYPARAAWVFDDRERAVIEGLVRARDALSTVAGERVAYDDLVFDEHALVDALRRLYPDRTVAPVSYRGPGFEAAAHLRLARRATPAYRRTEALVAEVERAITAAPAPSPRPADDAAFTETLAESVRRAACDVLPADATVAVVTLGRRRLLNLDGRRAIAVDIADLASVRDSFDALVVPGAADAPPAVRDLAPVVDDGICRVWSWSR